VSHHGTFGNVNPIEIDPAEGRVIYEELDGVLIQGARVLTPGPGDQRYWEQVLGPDMVWSPGERRLRVAVNKKTQRIRFENETEDYCELVLEDREPMPDAPDTGPLGKP